MAFRNHSNTERGMMATTVKLEDLVRFFRSEEMAFSIGNGNCLLITVRGQNTTLTVQVCFVPEKEVIGLHAACPFHVPQEFIASALEMAARINWGLLFATCEVHPKTGAVRFRSVMLVDDSRFNRAQFSTLFATGTSTADRYAPAFMKLMEGKSPVEALAGIEE
jgi:hypothetical protein